jgi:lysozyme
MDLKTAWGHWSTYLWGAALTLLCLFLTAPDFLLHVLPGFLPLLHGKAALWATAIFGAAGWVSKFIAQAWVADRLARLKARLQRLAHDASGAVKKVAAVGTGGLAAAMLLAAPMIEKWEGERARPYLDAVSVLTVCYGHTGHIENRSYSPAECRAMLNDDMMRSGMTILTCSPKLADHVYAFAAFLSFNFNTGGYCSSTARRLFDKGDYAGSCAQLSRWIFAGGHVLRGLELRRADERGLCEAGL